MKVSLLLTKKVVVYLKYSCMFVKAKQLITTKTQDNDKERITIIGQRTKTFTFKISSIDK
jgi:hypothetical protein|tara:strand:- start:761 stop:940 length:180 start_codon:yes stop_codon:yes gene_type:complete